MKQFNGVNFSGKKMDKELSGAVFEDCYFDASTEFAKSKLHKAEFHRCVFQGVDFSTAAGMKGVNIRGSTLENANFSRKQLYDMQVTGSRLIRCDLSKANLNNALFHETDCTGSDFTRSIWFNARFSDCNLNSCQVGFLTGPEYSRVKGCMNVPLRLLERTKKQLQFGDHISS